MAEVCNRDRGRAAPRRSSMATGFLRIEKRWRGLLRGIQAAPYASVSMTVTVDSVSFWSKIEIGKTRPSSLC